jgi:hypothetical protein
MANVLTTDLLSMGPPFQPPGFTNRLSHITQIAEAYNNSSSIPIDELPFIF